ncbi:hypothetical protein LINPERPRIM_LOCUS25450 [Linum perenne]
MGWFVAGISANVKLLLKVIQDHNEASSREYDERKPQRVAGMITILDDIKGRLEKSQSTSKKRVAQLRRCNTDLRPNRAGQKQVEKKPDQTSMNMIDDKEKLKKQLSLSLAARKSRKEKVIMGAELARRVSELSEMEEMVNLLKAQNDTLLSKLQTSDQSNSEIHNGNNVALQDRNKVLSDQLLKSLESYKALKRKFKSAKEESSRFRETVGEEAATGLAKIRSLKVRMVNKVDECVNIDGEICALEEIFEQFMVKVLEDKSGKRRSENS